MLPVHTLWERKHRRYTQRAVVAFTRTITQWRPAGSWQLASQITRCTTDPPRVCSIQQTIDLCVTKQQGWYNRLDRAGLWVITNEQTPNWVHNQCLHWTNTELPSLAHSTASRRQEQLNQASSNYSQYSGRPRLLLTQSGIWSTAPVTCSMPQSHNGQLNSQHHQLLRH